MIITNSLEQVRNLNKDIVIREAGPEDASTFVGLVNKQYLRKKDENFFYWMFIQNCVPTKLVTAYYKNKPIAFYGVLILKLNNGLNCSLSVEIIVEEKHRGRHLFLLLEDEAFRFASQHKAVAMTVFPNYYGMRAHDKIEQWKTAGKIDTLIFNCEHELTIRNDVKYQEDKQDFTYFLKDENYRKWRFYNSPVYNYNKINISEKVYCIIKIFEDPQNKTRFGDIVDFECELKSITKLKELFVRACETLIKEDIDYITSWALPHTYLHTILISLGFTSMSQERYFCIRVINPAYEYLKDIKHWHFVESDSEVY